MPGERDKDQGEQGLSLHGVAVLAAGLGWGNLILSVGRITSPILHHKRDIEIADRLFDPGCTGNHPFNTLLNLLETVLFRLIQSRQPPTGDMPLGNLSLWCCVLWRGVNIDERVYANQSESGEALVAGTHSSGGGNTSLASKCF